MANDMAHDAAGDVAVCSKCGTKNRLPKTASGRPRCASCHTDLPWLVNVADAEFREAVDTDQLVLVDLWAAWCGPCRMVAPVLEKLARNFVGDLKVVKVDVDANPMIARSFQASSIPMLVFLRSGKLLETVVGAQPEHVLTDKVRHHLASV